MNEQERVRRMKNAMANLVRTAGEKVFKRGACRFPEDVAKNLSTNQLNSISFILQNPVRAYMKNGMSRREAWEKALAEYNIPKVTSFESFLHTPWGSYLVGEALVPITENNKTQLVKPVGSEFAMNAGDYTRGCEFEESTVAEVSLHKILEGSDTIKKIMRIILVHGAEARDIKAHIHHNINGLADQVRNDYPEFRKIDNQLLVAKIWPLIQKIVREALDLQPNGDGK